MVVIASVLTYRSLTLFWSPFFAVVTLSLGAAGGGAIAFLQGAAEGRRGAVPRNDIQQGATT